MSEPQARASKMEELYAAHAQRAGRLAYFLVGDRDLAQDLVQEAFLKVFARWGNLRESQSFAAYLNRTIVNLAHKTHRRRGVERRYLEKQPNLEAVAQGARLRNGRRAVATAPVVATTIEDRDRAPLL